MTKPIISSKSNTIVALSGGVDSSVSAYLLQQQGHQVEGLFMKNWEEDDTESYCAAREDRADAQAICDQLQIPFHTVNFASEYWDNVFEYFLSEYRSGRTPNPDILCNREIKFKSFLDYAKSLGAEHMATGHYVRSTHSCDGWRLLRGKDKNKDQSYFLYTLTQAQLKQALFPVGELEKTEVRSIAKQLGLITHAKKDSTGICFIGEKRFKSFLSQYLPAQPGDILAEDGQVVAKHDGLMYYTIGQRKGLGIGGLASGGTAPWYVIGKNVETNQLLVGQGHEHPKLYSYWLDCSAIHWITPHQNNMPMNCTAKTRYRQQDAECKIEQIDDELFRVHFSQPQWAVTPGQSIVFYAGDQCLGGAIIIDCEAKPLIGESLE